MFVGNDLWYTGIAAVHFAGGNSFLRIIMVPMQKAAGTWDK